MFNNLAWRYDFLNHLLSLHLDSLWRKRAVQALAPKKDKTYLDLGCGTGDLILEIKRQQPLARVIGLDPAAEMLKQATQKFINCRFNQDKLLLGDGTDLPFAGQSINGIVSAFCLRNLANRKQAFAEIKRVLAPEGKIIFLELTKPQNCILSLLHHIYCRYWVGIAGRLAGRKDAYDYLAKSIENFPAPDIVQKNMGEAGFENCQITILQGGIVTIFSGENST